ncbi:MAG: hypothetical protein ACTHKU_14095, partial [Verrucomicrobiota bacterium]
PPRLRTREYWDYWCHSARRSVAGRDSAAVVILPSLAAVSIRAPITGPERRPRRIAGGIPN